MTAPADDVTAPLPDRILDAAEAALRRYGQEKTNVVDVARALGMSHGNIYRHFPSKKELLKAVAARWLEVVMVPLAAISEDESKPPTERLRLWFQTLRAAKKAKVAQDPELFRVHYQIVVNDGTMGERHVGDLVRLVEKIVADGIATGEFSTPMDAATAARSLLLAMSPFHHPLLILQTSAASDEDAGNVLELLIRGLGKADSRR